MNVKEAIKKRQHDNKGRLKIDRNVIRDADGKINEIRCWLCDGSVAGYVDDSVVETKEVGGQKIQVIRQRFSALGNYRKAEFKLSNGSKYTPIICANCADHVSLDDGKAIFARDLTIWDEQGMGDSYLNQMNGLDVVEFVGIVRK